MTTSVRRIVSSCFVLSVAVAGFALPAPAQAQYVQQRAAEGSHVWGDDGWCYVIQGGRPVRTRYRRVAVPGTNRTVFDIFENGRLLRRVGASPQQAAGDRQAASAEAELQRLIDQLNAEVAAEQARRPAPISRGSAAGAPRDRGTMAFCPPMRPPYMATNVRVNIPAYGCQTPEEKAWMARGIGNTQNAEALRQLGLCRRAPQAYRSERKINGVSYFRLDDGSEHRRGGTLNDGWMWGLNGMPQPKAGCF